MRRSTKSNWIVLLIALTMLTITMPSMATHNSVGPQVSIVVNDGEKSPDITRDSDVMPRFHEAAVEDGLIPEHRWAPADHAGQAYDEEKCDTYGESNQAYEDELDALAQRVEDEVGPDGDPLDASEETRETDLCWVGYFDVVYQVVLLNVGGGSGGPLYPVNPAPDDDYCRGEEDPNQPTGVPPVDELATRAERAASGDCDGDAHEYYNSPTLAVDRALLEAPVNDDEVGVGDELGNEGSISQTFPAYTRAYTLLFGQPHPSNEDPSDLEAGAPPFSPAPGDPTQGVDGLSTIVGDLSGACDQRTKQCKMLTPTDVKLYDTNRPDVEGDEGFARICEYLPQFVATDGVADLEGGICGPVGDAQDFFDPDAGGLGVDESPPTFVSTLPGFWSVWHNIETPYSTGMGASLALSYTSDDPSYTDNFHYFHAVNPEVPTEDHPLWCVVPGFLSEGTGVGPSGTQHVDESLDHGLYGDYVADAIDVHVAHFTAAPVADEVHQQTHPLVRSVLGPVEDLADEGTASVEELLEEEGVETPPEVEDALDRADLAAPGFEKPYNDLDNTQNDFSVDRTEGISCTAAAQPALTEGKTLDGGLVFDTELNQETMALKDFTQFDEDGLPQSSEDTERGTWQTDVYSFDGLVKGLLDSSEDGELSDCPDPGGQVPENQDSCMWEAYWDVYNSACTTFGDEPCDEQMRTLGYAVNGDDNPADGIGGIGMFFALEVSGPTVVTDTSPSSAEIVSGTFEERTTVLGLESPAATHCVIGTSEGFAPFLADHLGVAELGQATADLCPDADGEVHVVSDAFDDEGELERGQFSSGIEVAPLAPTPSSVEEQAGLGEDDSLCVAGLWSVQDGIDATDDTRGDLNHGPSDSPVVYGECLDLSTTSGNHHVWNPIG